jgi:hypothetical protein
MPNWVYNEIIVTGEASKVEALKKQVGASYQREGQELLKNEDGTLKFDESGAPIKSPVSNTVEEPFSFWNILKPSEEETNNYNDQGWYNWNIENWGTKWDVNDVDVRDDSPGHWHIYFETAWSAPHEALVALSEQHPEVEIRNEWREEQGFGAFDVYSGGTHWIDKEWNIPASHEEYEENVGEEQCYCHWTESEDDYPFSDCPRENETLTAVAQLEKVSETI